MKHAYLLGILLLAGSCGLDKTPVKLEKFCTSRYQSYTVDKVSLGDKAVALCLNKMNVCTEQELGTELNNYRIYVPYCYYLENSRKCETACQELDKEILKLKE